MPAPYRKACKFCAASKRRCDLALPRCSRCASRSIECLYEGVSLGSASTKQGGTPPALAVPASGNRAPIDAASLAVQSVPSPASLDLQTNELLHFTSSTTADVQDLVWSDLMANMENFVVPDLLEPHDSPDNSVLAGEIYQERIVYCVKQLKSFPVDFVQTSHTPFIHKSLYREHFPLALQDALSACALYGQRNDQNEAAVHRVISETAGRLLSAWSLAGLSALDQLAAVQSLILLQIVRLFDGNVRLRTEAELAESTLSAMLTQLRSRTQYLGDESYEVTQLLSGDPQVAWKNWLFAESLRRTLVMGYSIQGLYCFLKNGWDSSHHEFNSLSFYAQRRLWGAQSEYQWTLAAKGHAPFPMRFSSWQADAVDLQPTDIDVLGIMMVVLMKGLDECSHWAGQDLNLHLWLG